MYSSLKPVSVCIMIIFRSITLVCIMILFPVASISYFCSTDFNGIDPFRDRSMFCGSQNPLSDGIRTDGAQAERSPILASFNSGHEHSTRDPIRRLLLLLRPEVPFIVR